MTETWMLATIWLGLALLATLLSIWFKIATPYFSMAAEAHEK